MNRVESVDVIKGLCAFLVVFSHTINTTLGYDRPPVFDLYHYIRMLSVPFFLIVGGYVYALSRTKRKRDLKISSFSWKVFTRLIVPYYVAVSLLAIYNYVIGKEIYWPMFLFLDTNENGLYFVLVYVFSIFIFELFSRVEFLTLNSRLLLVLAIFSPLVYYFSLNYESFMPGYLNIYEEIAGFVFFASGVLIYLIEKVLVLRWSANRVLVSSFVGLAVVMFIALYTKIFFPEVAVFVSPPPTFFLIAYAFFAFIAIKAVFDSGYFINIFKSMRFDSIGKISFFIYLFHPFFLKAFGVYIERIANYYPMGNFSFIIFLVLAVVVFLLCIGVFKLLPKTAKDFFVR